MRGSALGLVCLGPGGRVVVWNSASEMLLGVRSEQALRRHFHDVLQEATRQGNLPGPASDGLAALVASTRERAEPVIAATLALAPGYQGPRVLLVDCFPLVNRPSRSAVVLLLRDGTAEHALRDQAHRADYARVTSGVAAAVAHQIRRPLSTIKLASQLLIQDCPVGPLRDLAHMIEAEADRLARTSEDLLLYARPPDAPFGAVHLPQLLSRVTQQVEQACASRGISISFGFDAGLPPARGDARSLEHAFLNLVCNAVDAMPEGGRLTLRARRLLSAAVDAVEIVVEDTGPGIPVPLQARIFDPFFSTKPSGSGLGLSIARRIVDAQGGAIRLRSTPGVGARFFVRLPVADQRHTSSALSIEALGGHRVPQQLTLFTPDILPLAVAEASPGRPR